jgi:pyruvate formate lyase activating enzyme
MTLGTLFDLQRTSLHDGPGICTAVFLKGCPLRCAWCHNPESQARGRAISFRAEVCAACGACVQVCPHGAHTIVPLVSNHHPEAVHIYNRDLCKQCGECAEACLYDALSVAGTEVTVAAVMDAVRKDIPYYQKSGGGLTITGGEPMLQPEFTLELLKAAKVEGIHTCLETCGWASQRAYQSVLPFVDLFLFDYKGTAPEAHRRWTGVSNELILANLDFLYRRGAQIWLRCPLIPTINDSDEHLAALAALEQRYPNLAGIELLPYHNIGNSKYARYGMENPLPALATADEPDKQRWMRAIHAAGGVKARLG